MTSVATAAVDDIVMGLVDLAAEGVGDHVGADPCVLEDRSLILDGRHVVGGDDAAASRPFSLQQQITFK